MSTPTIEALAIHEAGHAVVAIKLGIPLHSVDIVPEAEKGCCRDAQRNRTLTAGKMNDADWEWARKKALIVLGGEAAERVYHLEECPLPFCSELDEVELTELCCSAFGCLGPEASQWLKERRDETDRIVETNWKSICSLAELLMSKNHLSGDEAERAIRGRHSIDWD